MVQYLRDAWQPFIAAGKTALLDQRHYDAKFNFQMALLDAEMCQRSDRCIATTLDLLADTYQLLNQLEEAEENCLRSLRIKQKSGQFSHFDILRTMFKLSKLYYSQSKLGAAAYTTKKLLDLSEQTFAPSHPLIVLVARQLADLYNQLGSYREAEQFYQRANDVQKNQGDHGWVIPAAAPVCISL
jgi:tetratricopeptide (TPR) repeat protein